MHVNMIILKLLDIFFQMVQIEAKDNNDWTPLHYSAYSTEIFYSLTTLKYLVSKGANKYARDKNGKRPYDIALPRRSEPRKILL